MNSEKHIAIWAECLNIIRNIIEPRQFETWFNPVKAVSLTDETLTVEVPSDYFREYLESAFLDVISKTLHRVLGANAKLVYTMRPVKGQNSISVPASNEPVPANSEISVASGIGTANASPFVYPGLHKVKINSRLNSVYCFENLVEGECNKMAITWGINISAAPGNNPFNPLFIFGGPGLGKTHIAQAIGISAKRNFPDLTVLYVTGHEFKTQYMEAVNVRNKLTDFLAYYMKIDVLIVDDIQDLMGGGTQNAFFNIFNHLHMNGKQLILTSDRAPVNLQKFEERLYSRFKWGLSVELSRPDYQTRLAMLKALTAREGMDIEDRVLEYLATRIKTNFRELEGTLYSFQAHKTVMRDVDSMSIAESLTDKIVAETVSDLSVDSVQSVVCDYFNISRETLVSNTRKRNVVQARQIAMYLCRSHLSNCSLSTIGAEHGGKDHATVLHACTTVNDLIDTDKTFKKYVQDIERMLAPRA